MCPSTFTPFTIFACVKLCESFSLILLENQHPAKQASRFLIKAVLLAYSVKCTAEAPEVLDDDHHCLWLLYLKFDKQVLQIRQPNKLFDHVTHIGAFSYRPSRQ